jgi:hypothetical protein
MTEVADLTGVLSSLETLSAPARYALARGQVTDASKV